MKRPTRFALRVITWAVIGAVAVTLALGVAYVFASYAVRAEISGEAELPAECGVVFGAAVYGLSQPGPAIVRRITTAADLYKDGRVERLILTGGMGTGNRETEAGVMRKQAMMRGVLPSDITLEEESHSTWQNIEYVTPLIAECDSIVAISDGYHLARIKLLAWRHGWAELGTVATTTKPPEASELRSITREVLAYMYYLLFIDVVFPDIPTYLGYEQSGT